MLIKKLIFLIFISFFNSSFSQIAIKKIEYIGDTIVRKNTLYDGYSDFKKEKVLNDYKKYIGYNLYLTNSKVDIYNYIFDNQLKSILNKNGDTIFTYLTNPIKVEKVEKVISDENHLYNKNYRIENIFCTVEQLEKIFPEHEKTPELKYFETDDYNNLNYIVLQLKSLNDNKIYYLKQSLKDYRSDNSKDFIFEPFYNFVKNNYDNEKFIFTSNPSYRTYKDIYTDKIINIERNSIWNSEVAVINSYRLKNKWEETSYPFKIYILFKNQKGETFVYEGIDNINFQENPYSFGGFELYSIYLEKVKLKKTAQEIKKIKEQKEKDSLQRAQETKRITIINKYGNSNGSLIINNKVKIGMSSEMCEESWGKPFDKSKIIEENKNIEIWFYFGGNTLYFLNDKLYRIITD